MELRIRGTTLNLRLTPAELRQLAMSAESSSPMTLLGQELRGPQGFTYLLISRSNEPASKEINSELS